MSAAIAMALPYESHRLQIRIGKVRRWGLRNDPHPRACAGGDLCRGIDTGQVLWRRQNSVAEQGNKGGVARVALAVPTKEHAGTFTDPGAHFQGRGGTRSLEAGHHRPFSDPK